MTDAVHADAATSPRESFLGPLLRRLAGDGEAALMALIALALVAVVVSVAIWGYPALIVAALAATFSALATLVVITFA